MECLFILKVIKVRPFQLETAKIIPLGGITLTRIVLYYQRLLEHFTRSKFETLRNTSNTSHVLIYDSNYQ